MKNKIAINHQVLCNPKQFCRLPVRYRIENDPVTRAAVVHCAIDIPREYIPSWLRSQPLETTYFRRGEVQMALYNIGEVVTPDAEAFCQELYREIMLAEKQNKAVSPG